MSDVEGSAFERRPDPWGDVSAHVLRYGAPSFVPELIDHARGSWIHTEDGRAILDFTSGQMSATLGHAHPAVVRMLQRTAPRLDHLFSGMLSRPVVNLSTRLAERAGGVRDIAGAGGEGSIGGMPEALSRVMLVSTGSEVNDAAIRLATLVTGRFEIVSFSRSWHGVTRGAAGATYSSARRTGIPGPPGQIAIPTPYAYRPDFTHPDGTLDWRRQLLHGFEMVDAQSVGSLAACIVEPILSGGGVIVPPPGYLAALRDECHRRGMLLILDEAQTSMGRTGYWFGFEHDGVTPDILTLSKTLGAGLPLAALMTTDRIEALAHDLGFVFFTSHVSDPLVAAVGCTVMDVIEEEGLLVAARQRGAQLAAGLREIMDRHDVVGDVRGRGLLQGMEIVESKASRKRSERIGDRITAECLDRGLHLNIVCLPGMGGVLRIAPPLTVSAPEIDLALEMLEESVAAVEAATAIA